MTTSWVHRSFAGVVDRPGTQVETRGVQRAFDLAALQPTVGERRVLMRTGVVDREHLTVVGVEDRDRWIGFHPPRLTAGQGRQWTDFEHDVDLPGWVRCSE